MLPNPRLGSTLPKWPKGGWHDNSSSKVNAIGWLSLLILCLAGCPAASEFPAPPPPPAAVQPAEPLSEQHPATAAEHSPALAAFLAKFDALSARGFVPTLRSGSTGIGYTFETMLDIQENNSPGGDFMRMEIKAYRDDNLTLNDAEKMNLFLKEPKWTDGLTAAQHIKTYGYVDDNGRQALYSTVTKNENSHGFALVVDKPNAQVVMTFHEEPVGFWTNAILEKRLIEKHSQTVFVSAHVHGTGNFEMFHFYGVNWCQTPSVDKFLTLIEEGAVMLELRMHIKPTGGARNHGSAFRIKQNRIRDVYHSSIQVR